MLCLVNMSMLTWSGRMSEAYSNSGIMQDLCVKGAVMCCSQRLSVCSGPEPPICCNLTLDTLLDTGTLQPQFQLLPILYATPFSPSSVCFNTYYSTVLPVWNHTGQ